MASDYLRLSQNRTTRPMGYSNRHPRGEICNCHRTNGRSKLLRHVKSPPRLLPTIKTQIRNPNQLLHPRPQQRTLWKTRHKKVRTRKNRNRRKRPPHPLPKNPNGTTPKSHPQRTNDRAQPSNRHREPTNQKRNKRNSSKKICTKRPPKRKLRPTKNQNQNNLRHNKNPHRRRQRPHEILTPRPRQRRKTRIIRPNPPPLKLIKNSPKTTSPLRRNPHDIPTTPRRTRTTQTTTRPQRHRNPRTIILLKQQQLFNKWEQ